MPNAYISGTGFYVPPRVVTNDDLAKQFGIALRTVDHQARGTGFERHKYRAGAAAGHHVLHVRRQFMPAQAIGPCHIQEDKLGRLLGIGERQQVARK